MWCSICRQDVPGSLVPGGGQYSCPRCGEMMPSSDGRPAETPQEEPQEAGPSIAKPPPTSDYDEWEMEERLRHLDRVYARNPLSGPLSRSGTPQFRIDSQHPPVPREQPVRVRPAEARPSWLARLGRLGLGLGLAITVCGACLMIWAHHGGRPDLMPIGVPIAVAGLVLLLVGLVFQFDEATDKPHPAAKAPRGQYPLSMGDTSVRFDAGPDGSPQLTDLAARLDELSRKLDDK